MLQHAAHVVRKNRMLLVSSQYILHSATTPLRNRHWLTRRLMYEQPIEACPSFALARAPLSMQMFPHEVCAPEQKSRRTLEDDEL